MAKSLKEALLEQMATLQERGLAPGELPVEQEEEQSYRNYDDDSGGRTFGGDRDREPRRRTAGAGGRQQRSGPRGPALRPREQRELRETRGGRERREVRPSREGRDLPPELTGPAPLPPLRPAPLRVGPPGGGPPRPMGPPGAPRPAFAGPRPAPRADMLRRNAERLQREQQERNDIRQLLTTYSGEEADDAALEKFFSQLAVETGALPPLHVVLGALQNAGNAETTEVGNQVRLHYRRARSRVAPAPVAVS